MPAIPMAAAQFRHGAVEVVSQETCAFVFASQPETRELDVRLGADLRHLGAQVHVIQEPGSERAFSGAWATVLEIVPIQIAAARLAESRGIPPGEFRFVPQVTTDEVGFELRS